MQVRMETAKFAWNYDSLMGVGNFTRKSDGAITLLETGDDCQTVVDMFERLWDKQRNGDITEERRDEVFDMYVSEFSFELY